MLTLVFMLCGLALFGLVFVGVLIRNPSQLGTTAAAEISAVSGGLGLMFGYFFTPNKS